MAEFKEKDRVVAATNIANKHNEIIVRKGEQGDINWVGSDNLVVHFDYAGNIRVTPNEIRHA